MKKQHKESINHKLDFFPESTKRNKRTITSLCRLSKHDISLNSSICRLNQIILFWRIFSRQFNKYWFYFFMHISLLVACLFLKRCCVALMTFLAQRMWLQRGSREIYHISYFSTLNLCFIKGIPDIHLFLLLYLLRWKATVKTTFLFFLRNICD